MPEVNETGSPQPTLGAFLARLGSAYVDLLVTNRSVPIFCALDAGGSTLRHQVPWGIQGCVAENRSP